MELVYLWVDDYKNIQKQGFNFSPRFTCKYEDGELTIDENKEHVEDFFGKNINVTAIVGENGSGKSSIIEFLAEIFRIEYNKNRNLIVDNEHTYNFYLVFKIKDKTYEIKRISNIDKHSFQEDEKIENILDYHIYSNDKQNIVNQIILDNSTIAKMIVYSHNENQDFKLSSFMYLPNEITIKLCDFNEKFEKLISNNKLYPMNRSESDSVYIKNMSNEINNQYEHFSSLEDKYDQFLILKLLENNEETHNFHLTKKEMQEKLTAKKIEFVPKVDFKKYFKISERLGKKLTKEVNALEEQEKEIYINKYSDFFEFDFIDEKNRRYSDLSHGEKILFGQLLNIFYNSKKSKNDSLLFLFDEPETAMHPQWQKNYINEVYNLVNKLNKNYHFILTSHSPFILSDLPKENVIFLKDGKQVDVDIDTFGANIHTLLSHGFFMQNGLMGEFAKEKINDVINYLNDKNTIIKSDNEAQKIVNIIGEPILKRQLQKMLDSKRLSEVEQIKKQIKELQEELAKKEDKKDD